MPVLRKAFDAESLNQLWQTALHSPHKRGVRCPICKQNSRNTVMPLKDGPSIEFDVCATCNAVWSDHGEFNLILRKSEVQSQAEEELPLEAREAMAMLALEQIKEKQKIENEEDRRPEHWWQWVLGLLLGVPVEVDSFATRKTPWATWSLSVLILIAFLLQLAAGGSPDSWAFTPNKGLLQVGLFLSFLVHAGWIHLLGNLYFLVVFGDDVEDRLGPIRFLLLFISGCVAGSILHGLFDPRAGVPCVGASHGISAILVYHALIRPFARVMVTQFMLLIFMRGRWISLPIWAAFLIYLAFQFIALPSQLVGLSSVSVLAHLGGILAGLCFFIAMKAFPGKPAQEKEDRSMKSEYDC